jgi:hypothetical protein
VSKKFKSRPRSFTGVIVSWTGVIDTFRRIQRIPTDPVNVGLNGSVQQVKVQDRGSSKRRKGYNFKQSLKKQKDKEPESKDQEPESMRLLCLL